MLRGCLRLWNTERSPASSSSQTLPTKFSGEASFHTTPRLANKSDSCACILWSEEAMKFTTEGLPRKRKRKRKRQKPCVYLQLKLQALKKFRQRCSMKLPGRGASLPRAANFLTTAPDCPRERQNSQMKPCC